MKRSAEPELRSVWLPADPSSGIRAWCPENVLRSFQDVRLGLHKDIPDLVEVAEICALMSRFQADTDRVGKTAKRVSEGRFEGRQNKSMFDESKGDEKD